MTESLFLLLDQGGQGCRAMVVDGAGRLLCRAERSITTREDGAGGVEQDGEEIIAAMSQALSEAAETLGDDIRRVKTAGLTVQRGSVLCWARDSGRPLTPVLSWRDRRGGRPADEAQRAWVKRETGLRFSPYGGAAKLRWCLEHVPAVNAALEQGRLAWGPLGAFLCHRLLRERPHAVDPSLAQRTLLWSRHSGDWSPELMDFFGLPAGALPALAPGRHPYGHLEGLPGEVPLALLAGDQNVLPWLAGGPGENAMCINAGTGAFMLCPLPAGEDSPRYQSSLLDDRHVAMEASVHGAGSALNWLARTENRKIPFGEFSRIRDAVQDPPLFLNSIDGLGSPWWLPGPEPTLGGQATSVEARGRGGRERIAFLVRVNLETMEALRGPVDRVLLSGGLSRSDMFCQLLADSLGRGVHRLTGGEGTAMGLWCRLSGKGAERLEFEKVSSRRDDGLSDRFSRWLAHLPAIELD
jgi:glycerol kinase